MVHAMHLGYKESKQERFDYVIVGIAKNHPLYSTRTYGSYLLKLPKCSLPQAGLAPKKLGGKSVCFETLILQDFIIASYSKNALMLLLTEDRPFK